LLPCLLAGLLACLPASFDDAATHSRRTAEPPTRSGRPQVRQSYGAANGATWTPPVPGYCATAACEPGEPGGPAACYAEFGTTSHGR
jgi:hypothetical protein